MAVPANALNLAQYAMLSNDPLVQAVTFSLRDNGSVLADIPFVTKKTMKVDGRRFEGNLPGVNWANVNEEGTTVSGDPKAYSEQAFIIRNYIDVDHVLVEDTNSIVDPRAIQLEAYLKSVSYDINDKFINNNHESGNSKAFVGIRKRLDAPTVFGTLAASKIDAGGATADMSPSLTAATANKFMEKLDEALYAVASQDGDGVVLYMNATLKRRLATAARIMGTTGGFSTDKDQYDRVIERYRGAVIKDIGVKADQTTNIITNTEAASGADGASTFTSLYAVKYSQDGLMGWQFSELVAKDLGLMENGVIYRTFMEWVGGLVAPGIRAFARVYDIKIS
jgi:hypothetical protein